MEAGNRKRYLTEVVIQCFVGLVVLLVLFLGVSCSQLLTVSADYSGDWSYLCIDNKAYITGYSGDAEKVIVPSRLDGHHVISVGIKREMVSTRDWWRYGSPFEYSKAKTVVIPSSVKYIGDEAFDDMENLEQVEDLELRPRSVAGHGASSPRARRRAGCAPRRASSPPRATPSGSTVRAVLRTTLGQFKLPERPDP